jgi:hypothetical protein
VLEEKLKFKQLKDYCPDFVGENSVADATKYYAEKGELLQEAVTVEKNDRNAARQVSFVSTNGLDTELINKVLTEAICAGFVQNLQSSGVL